MLTKVRRVKAMVFPVVVYGCGHKGGWVPKNWCFWTVVLKKTFGSTLDNKQIKPVNPKGDQSWIFIGRSDAKALIPCSLDAKSQPTGKDLMLGKTEGRRRRGNRGWDGWVASSTQWTWVWANSRKQWRIRKPGVLQSMGLQRVRHDWATERQQSFV